MEKLLSLICFLGLIAAVCAAPRIVGGEKATATQFPHQIALQVDVEQRLHCSGSILSDSWCVTAAHCVADNDDPNYYTVAVGSNIYQNLVKYAVNRVIPHENYENFTNDIALIELKTHLTFSDTINKIAIYKGFIIPLIGQIVISGWGRISTTEPPPDILQYNDKIAKATDLSCQIVVGDIYYPGLYCLQHLVDNGACFGDSGGPAQYKGKLIGVANFVMGGGCGTVYPDGYCNIAYFISWINGRVGYQMV